MVCLFALLAAFAPRIALFLLWIFTPLVNASFNNSDNPVALADPGRHLPAFYDPDVRAGRRPAGAHEFLGLAGRLPGLPDRPARLRRRCCQSKPDSGHGVDKLVARRPVSGCGQQRLQRIKRRRDAAALYPLLFLFVVVPACHGGYPTFQQRETTHAQSHLINNSVAHRPAGCGVHKPSTARRNRQFCDRTRRTITAQFGVDGTLSGADGCNRYPAC